MKNTITFATSPDSVMRFMAGKPIPLHGKDYVRPTGFNVEFTFNIYDVTITMDDSDNTFIQRVIPVSQSTGPK